MFRAIKRMFIWLGLMAERATETDAINQAVVERGIRDSKVKADKAHYANGQLAGQIALLKDQIKRQERQRDDLQGMLQAAAAANDEANGAHYAEELATIEQDLADNKNQADSLEQLYKQNTEIIAQSLREIQKFQREFEAVKAKVAIGRSLENLAGMMKSSISELQGMMGGEITSPCSNFARPLPAAKARCAPRWTSPGKWVPVSHVSRRCAKPAGQCYFRNTKKRWAWSNRRSPPPPRPLPNRRRNRRSQNSEEEMRRCRAEILELAFSSLQKIRHAVTLELEP